MAQTSCTFRDLIENFPAVPCQPSRKPRQTYQPDIARSKWRYFRVHLLGESMAPNRFRTEILRRTSTRPSAAPLCFEIPLISKRSATTFEWKQWIPQPALFRTWKFSVRPTFGTTTRKFQAWLEVKMGEYISAAMTPQRAPSASTIRTKLLLTVSLCLSLSLSFCGRIERNTFFLF